MFTLAMICSMFGFYILYQTSRKSAPGSATIIPRWLTANPSSAKLIGLLLMLLAFPLLIWRNGTGVGVIQATLLWMTTAFLIITVAPLRYLNIRHIFMLIAGSLLFELVIF